MRSQTSRQSHPCPPPRRTAVFSLASLLALALAALSCGSDESPARDSSPSVDSVVSSAAKTSCKVDKADKTSSSIGRAQFPVVNGSTTPHTGSVPLMPGQEKAIGGILYGGSSQGCSGTIVADRAVITASHCMIDYFSWDGQPSTVSKYILAPAEVSFGVGKDMKKPDHTFAVKEIHVNPDVRNTFDQLENDMAVLILTESATTKVPGLVPIPVNLEAISSSEVGAPVELGGFGSLTCGTYDFSPVRYFAKLKLYKVLERDLGVQSVSGSPSMGDSGSGLLLERSDGKTRVASLLSIGISTCAENAGPRLDRYGGWLTSVLPDGCGSMTAAGTCASNVAIWCDGKEIVSESCSTSKKTCAKDTCGQSRCIDKPASTDERCKSLDYFGRCTGEVAEWCVEGQFKARDCGALKQTCVKSSSPLVGYTCSGSLADAGAGDGGAGKEQSWSDFSIPTGSCETLDACMTKCANDLWCSYSCFYAVGGTSKVLWGSWTWCVYCGMYADKNYCDTGASYFGKCETACASSTTYDAGGSSCDDCLTSLCSSYEKACKADRKEAGVEKDGGASKGEAGSGG
jgi:hypothetical protein